MKPFTEFARINIHRSMTDQMFEVGDIEFSTNETLEDMVIYSPLKSGDFWVRPASMWNEIVDNKGTHRFTKID